MNPRAYHELAERLVSSPAPAPADCRAAISRAYYAAFNVGAELLRAAGFPVGRGAGAHGEVRHCLANCGDADVALAVSRLGDLHTDRNRADYHMERADVERQVKARAAVHIAAEIIRTFDAAFGGSSRGQLQLAIQAWRRANGYP